MTTGHESRPIGEIASVQEALVEYRATLLNMGWDDDSVAEHSKALLIGIEWMLVNFATALSASLDNGGPDAVVRHLEQIAGQAKAVRQGLCQQGAH